MKDEKTRLIEWFQSYSLRVWERIEFCKSTKRNKASETTITEDLVYDFFLLSRRFDLPIQIYESNKERILGNDLEFAIETKKGYLLFPTQAKKIKSKGRYSFISHIVKLSGIFQIDLLENYAQKIKGIPMYLFYNHFDSFEFYNEIKDLKKIVDFDISYYGCSVATSQTVQKFKKGQKWNIPTFWDIHPHSGVPIFHLLEIIGETLNSCQLFQKGSGFKKTRLRYYSEKEITEDFDGENIAPRPRIGYIPGSDKKKKKSLLNSLLPVYQPRYRIVISSNPKFNKFMVGYQG